MEVRKALAGMSLTALLAVGLAACGGGGGGGSTSAYPGNGDANAGKAAFSSGGCVGCHTVQGVSQGQTGPDLTHVGARLSADQIFTQIKSPAQRPAPYATPPQKGANMPSNNLSDKQRADITAWLAGMK